MVYENNGTVQSYLSILMSGAIFGFLTFGSYYIIQDDGVSAAALFNLLLNAWFAVIFIQEIKGLKSRMLRLELDGNILRIVFADRVEEYRMKRGAAEVESAGMGAIAGLTTGQLKHAKTTFAFQVNENKTYTFELKGEEGVRFVQQYQQMMR